MSRYKKSQKQKILRKVEIPEIPEIPEGELVFISLNKDEKLLPDHLSGFAGNDKPARRFPDGTICLDCSGRDALGRVVSNLIPIPIAAIQSII